MLFNVRYSYIEFSHGVPRCKYINTHTYFCDKILKKTKFKKSHIPSQNMHNDAFIIYSINILQTQA